MRQGARELRVQLLVQPTPNPNFLRAGLRRHRQQPMLALSTVLGRYWDAPPCAHGFHVDRAAGGHCRDGDHGRSGLARTGRHAAHPAPRYKPTANSCRAANPAWHSGVLTSTPAPLPNTPALDWDGRALRLTRRNVNDSGLLVVAWTRRADDGGNVTLAVRTLQSRGDLRDAWLRAAQWAQTPAPQIASKRTVLPLAQWQVFYYRADA